MKTINIILVICLFTLHAKSQNSYGTAKYQHSNSTLCSGTVTSINPGFLMAGHELTNNNSGYNFTLDRMDIGGVIGGNTWNFQNGYKLFGNSICGIGLSQIFNCAGVSIIEKTNFSTYGLAGAMNYGCFFAALDNGGAITQKKSYLFPVSPTYVTKPLITESLVHTDEYYIVGAYDGIMYILRIDTIGNIKANYTSDITASNYSLFPTSILESPYGSSELTIVGYLNDNNSDQDGFFYQIPNNLPTTGATVFNRYDISNSNGNNNVFSAMVLANSTNPTSSGFLIGGGSVSGSVGAPGTAWMLKLNPSGTVIWSTVIDGTTDAISGKIHGVIERYSAANTIYECYGACEANSGITVYKLDETGTPFSVNFPGNNDEFVYNSGSNSNTWPVNITYNQIGSTYDVGLHLYGNLDITGPGNHYFVQAYFSGQDGCTAPTTIAAYDQTNPNVSGVTDASGSTLTPCIVFLINVTQLSAYTAICGPVSSIGGASNNKLTGLESLSIVDQKQEMLIYPNPVNNKTKITYSSQNQDLIKINLYNSLGQLVRIFHTSGTKGVYSIEIDFDALGLENGVYFINSSNDTAAIKQKIIYIKE